MIEAVGVRREWLPQVSESPEVCARVSREAAGETGLLEGTPIVAGAGDQAAQAVGTGIVAQGAVSCTIGTSGVIFAASDSYRVEPQGRLHAFCHAVPGTWHLMGVMLSAGGSLRWLRDTLGEPEVTSARAQGLDPYDLLVELAAKAPAGSNGLTFLPYLTGERTPHNDPEARAAFAGLTLPHGRAEIVRSVLEGVTFGLRDGLELMRGLGVAPREIRASGGGARSAFWRQMLADVFGCRIACVNVADGAAYGAALLAGVGAGVWSDVPSACAACVQVTQQHDPRPEAAGAYQSAFARFRALYPALRGR
jgi:xylulokinase